MGFFNNERLNTLYRCDQATDCEDINDEKGCKIVVIDQNNYLKDKPPKEAVLKIKIELLKILEIGEVEMLFDANSSSTWSGLTPGSPSLINHQSYF